VTLTMDSRSNVNVFVSDELVENVTECQESIIGIGGYEIEAKSVGESILGRTFIVPDNGLNLISLNQARKVSKVTLVDNGAAFESIFEDGKRFIFNCNEGLYECEVEIQKWNPCVTLAMQISREINCPYRRG
jgi:hypothetical protein